MAAVVGMLALVGAGCGSASAKGASSGRSPTSTASAPSTSSAASRTATAASVSVVVCPSTFGGRAGGHATIPSRVALAVPAGVVGSVAVYVDSDDLMRVVAPRGWSCTATYGVDGSGGVAAYPSGTKLPAKGTYRWMLDAGSSVQALVGYESSACSSCTLALACPLFPAAAAAIRQQVGVACPVTKPASETVDALGGGVVAFTDPPRTFGDASPSGGADAADGVMTYHPGSSSGSWLETCTLPAVDRAVCTAALDTFVSAYGAR